MQKKYKLFQIDSFTKNKFTGNPASVITNADGLNEEEMQKIAREMNNSETAFVFSSESDGYDYHVRFFTPLKEVPICGHATIATHYALAKENKFENIKIYQKTGAGILPVEIYKENDDYKIVMTQGKIEFGEIIQGQERKQLLEALNISEDDLIKDYKIQIVSTGHSKVMIGIKNKELLDLLKPNYQSLTKLSEEIKCNGYYVFTMNSSDNECLINGRMFAPAVGINEDPVTGNANGPLGAYLIHHKLIEHNGEVYKFKATQGEAMKRAGVIEVEVKINDNEPTEVKISGNAVIVFETELIL